MSSFLSEPIRKSFFGFGIRKTIRTKTNGGVFGSRSLVDEQIIISRTNFYVVNKSVGFKEFFTFIGQISTYSHIWFSCLCPRKILNSRKHGFKSNQFVQKRTFYFFVSSVA